MLAARCFILGVAENDMDLAAQDSDDSCSDDHESECTTEMYVPLFVDLPLYVHLTETFFEGINLFFLTCLFTCVFLLILQGCLLRR